MYAFNLVLSSSMHSHANIFLSCPKNSLNSQFEFQKLKKLKKIMKDGFSFFRIYDDNLDF